MIWKASLILVILALTVKCEPPATSYGVPFTNNNNNFGSTNYGPPPVPSDVNNFVGNNGYGNHGDYNGNGNGYDHGHHEGADHDHSEPKSYEFGYAVKDDYTGNDYKRREQSDGNQVQGEYRVQLPDGRTQIVTYYADWKTGFHADVRYEGTAQYPDQYKTYGNNNNNYGNFQNGPSNQYGAPFGNGAPNNQYGAPNGNFNGGASSNVNIKDFSGPGEPYNTGHNNNFHGNYGNDGISNGNHFDSYTNTELTGNRSPNSHYGAP